MTGRMRSESQADLDDGGSAKVVDLPIWRLVIGVVGLMVVLTLMI